MSITQETLIPEELFWAENYTYLQELGYRLRPRYSPNWRPSWILPDGSKRPEPLSMFEDAHVKCTKTDKVMDATRLSDGVQVVLRKAETDKAEYLMLLKFNSAELRCGANHTVPLLGVLPLPSSNTTVLVVMPKLMRFSNPKFETRGEIVEAICQIIESVAFMHSLNIVHGDIGPFNIMMDASRVCYAGFHFVRDETVDGWGVNRTLKYRPRREVMPVSYYLIDFETARHFPEGHAARIDPRHVRSALRRAPEMFRDEPVDPFALDLFNLGLTFGLIFDDYDEVDDLFTLFYTFVDEYPEERPDAHAVLDAIRAFAKEKGRAWLDKPIPRPRFTGY